jgi:hypothetical protein
MADATESDNDSDLTQDETAVVNRLAHLALGLIPAFVAALAAIGAATGGLSRLFRDQNRTAIVALSLALLSVVLAALARALGPGAASGSGRGGRPGFRAGVKTTCLVLSVAVLFAGLFLAVAAQIGVMGTSQAPEIFGNVSRNGKEYAFEGEVRASGVKSRDRITIYAYQTDDEADSRGRPELLQSSTGPNADGVVKVPVKFPIHTDALGHLIVLTAVLGEHQRDCDGRLLEAGTGEPDTRTVGCLVVRMP